MTHLSVNELMLCVDSIYTSLFGPQVYSKWKLIKERLQFEDEESFVTWMLNYVEETLMVSDGASDAAAEPTHIDDDDVLVAGACVSSDLDHTTTDYSTFTPSGCGEYGAGAGGPIRVKQQRKRKYPPRTLSMMKSQAQQHGSLTSHGGGPSEINISRKEMHRKQRTHSSLSWSDMLINIARSSKSTPTLATSNRSENESSHSASNYQRPKLLPDDLKISQKLGPASDLLLRLGEQEQSIGLDMGSLREEGSQQHEVSIQENVEEHYSHKDDLEGSDKDQFVESGKNVENEKSLNDK